MSPAKRKQILIGLTGSIACGKSTALACFEKLGAAVLSADEIVRGLYQKPSVCRALNGLFGTSNPAQIAALVFGNNTARKQLEALLHPLVWKEMQAQLKKISVRCVVLELPLLFEAGWQDRVDVTLLICGGKKSCKARLKACGLCAKEYQKRLAAQLPEAEKIRRADVCVFNDATPRELEEKITRFYKALKLIYHF